MFLVSLRDLWKCQLVVESVPLESLHHVKWVRRRIAKGEVELSVILRLADEYKEDSEAIPEAFISLSMLIVCVFLKQKFPSILLNQKKNGEEQNKIWPTSYHPSTNLDGVATPSEGDLQMIFKYMKVVIQMSKLSYIGGEVLNAAIIVDPMHGQIIANGYDHTHPRPSTRATITGHGCNDGCGVTTESDESNSSELGSSQNVIVRTFSLNKCSKKSAGVSFLNPWAWTAQKPTNQISMSRSKSKYTGHPLQHAALVAIENAAARDRKLFPGSGSSECQPEIVDRLLCTPDKSLSERQKVKVSEKHCSVEEVADKSESSEVLRPYLCTGFDIYLWWEPCMMCAMALVHQRIRRICYALPNPHAGALGSVYRLHGQKSLNHHYSVFRILIPEQDLELMESNASDSS